VVRAPLSFPSTFTPIDEPGVRGMPGARYRAAVSADEAGCGSASGAGRLSARAAAGDVLTASTLEYLRGRWSVTRRISDRLTGQSGAFRGQASFRSVFAPPKVLEYREEGELRFGRYRGPASRSLMYSERADGGADVQFADGRPFYRLDLSSGSWDAEHLCRDDRYLVTTTRLSADSFTEAWRVTGTAKDYEMTTTYVRAGCEA
jgi:Family of unknown function (DUF6314)